jgi:hypothetical protein
MKRVEKRAHERDFETRAGDSFTVDLVFDCMISTLRSGGGLLWSYKTMAMIVANTRLHLFRFSSNAAAAERTESAGDDDVICASCSCWVGLTSEAMLAGNGEINNK